MSALLSENAASGPEVFPPVELGRCSEGFPVARVGDIAFAMLPGRDGWHYVASGWRISRPLARRVANFILAWWNAESLGGFDLADLFAVDTAIASDMALVFGHIAQLSNAEYPTEYRADIEAIIAQWRPEIWARSLLTA